MQKRMVTMKAGPVDLSGRIKSLILRYEGRAPWSCYWEDQHPEELLVLHLDRKPWLRGPLRAVEVQYYVPELREAFVYESRPDLLERLRARYPEENPDPSGALVEEPPAVDELPEPVAVWVSGHEAYQLNQTLDANPHLPGGVRYLLWKTGWEAAQLMEALQKELRKEQDEPL